MFRGTMGLPAVRRAAEAPVGQGALEAIMQPVLLYFTSVEHERAQTG